jgi:hypothetical protein
MASSWDAGELVERAPDLEARLIVARPLALARRGQRPRGGRGLRGQRLQMRLDRRIARRQLPLIGVEEGEVLLQHEDLLRTVVPGERGADLRRGGVTARVAMPREDVRVGMPGDDVADNAQPREAGEVTEHGRQVQVHLEQRLLHALDMRGGALDQGFAVAQIRAQGGDGRGGTEAAAQQADTVQLLEPLAVQDVGFAAGDVLHVLGVDEHDGHAARLENLVERDPAHPGGFHRHRRDAAGHEPVGEAVEVGREGLERTDRGGVAILRDGDVMLRAAAIDARGVGVNALEERGARGGFQTVTTRLALHGYSSVV